MHKTTLSHFMKLWRNSLVVASFFASLFVSSGCKKTDAKSVAAKPGDRFIPAPAHPHERTWFQPKFKAAGKTEMAFMGFVNQRGQWLIPPRFAEVSSFRNGAAIVKVRKVVANTRTRFAYSDYSGLIDKRGNWLIKPTYRWFHWHKSGLIEARSYQNKKWRCGLLDRSGKWKFSIVTPRKCKRFWFGGDSRSQGPIFAFYFCVHVTCPVWV